MAGGPIASIRPFEDLVVTGLSVRVINIVDRFAIFEQGTIVSRSTAQDTTYQATALK